MINADARNFKSWLMIKSKASTNSDSIDENELVEARIPFFSLSLEPILSNEEDQ